MIYILNKPVGAFRMYNYVLYSIFCSMITYRIGQRRSKYMYWNAKIRCLLPKTHDLFSFKLYPAPSGTYVCARK